MKKIKKEGSSNKKKKKKKNLKNPSASKIQNIQISMKSNLELNGITFQLDAEFKKQISPFGKQLKK